MPWHASTGTPQSRRGSSVSQLRAIRYVVLVWAPVTAPRFGYASGRAPNIRAVRKDRVHVAGNFFCFFFFFFLFFFVLQSGETGCGRRRFRSRFGSFPSLTAGPRTVATTRSVAAYCWVTQRGMPGSARTPNVCSRVYRVGSAVWTVGGSRRVGAVSSHGRILGWTGRFDTGVV